MGYPLEGIKILDFSIAVAAPLGAAMLADMGAEVIKIERVQGEPMRLGLPAGMDNTLETKMGEWAVDQGSWIALNRGKKSLAIDIRYEKGKEIVLKVEDRVVDQGKLIGLSDDGGLILQTDSGAMKIYQSGEIQLRLIDRS